MINILRDFFVIFIYNFKDTITKLFFKVFTVVITIFILIGLLVPDFIFKSNIFKNKNEYLIYIVDSKNYIFDDHLSLNIFSIANKDLVNGEYYFELINGKTRRESLDEDLKSGKMDGYLFVNGKKDIDIVTLRDLPELKFILDRFIFNRSLNGYSEEGFVKYNLKSFEMERLQDVLKMYLVPVVFMFLMYLFFIIYGQLISFSVNLEKGSKLIEIFLTKVKLSNIILGKVFGILAAGILQMIYFVGLMILILNFMSFDKFPIIKNLFSLNLDFILKYFVYFILGFTFYGFLFLFVGNLVKRTEQLSIGIIPIITFISLGYFSGMFSIQYSQNFLTNILKCILFFTSFIVPFTPINFVSEIILFIAFVLSIILIICFNINAFKYFIMSKGKK